jgi:hypothetical protein
MIHLPGVPLIPQTKGMACWYAASQMLVQWKRGRMKSTQPEQPDPSQVPETVKWHAADNGLTYGQVLTLSELLGFRAVPPISMTVRGIQDLLRWHGPIWVHGTQHIVVFVGADAARDRIFVHDPWPPNAGAKGWRPYARWFIRGNDAASQATSVNVEASFLYYP